MKTNDSIMEQKVNQYFNCKGATILTHLPINITSEAIYEYLAMLIDQDDLEIPGFKLQSYSCSCFDEDHIIHNFYFELTTEFKTHEEALAAMPGIHQMLESHNLLQQDYSQPKPFYTLYAGSLYITIIGEA